MSRGEQGLRRRHTRELALQGMYQWLLHNTSPGAGSDAPSWTQCADQAPTAQIGILQEFLAQDSAKDETPPGDAPPVDIDFFVALLHGAIGEADTLRARLAPFLSRSVAELSPIEHAILLLGAHELTHDLETPYKVVINEAIELAKKYGGTDGHRFVNGVLDRLATKLRPAEITNVRTARP
jgi:N utilization substance protein B